MVKSVETRQRNGERSLQLSLTETEAFLLDAVLANVQRSTEGPHARLAKIGDALAEFLEDADVELEDMVAEKFGEYVVSGYEMEYDLENGKGLHFPKDHTSSDIEELVSVTETETKESAEDYLNRILSSFKDTEKDVDTLKENKDNTGSRLIKLPFGYVEVFDLNHFRGK